MRRFYSDDKNDRKRFTAKMKVLKTKSKVIPQAISPTGDFNWEMKV